MNPQSERVSGKNCKILINGKLLCDPATPKPKATHEVVPVRWGGEAGAVFRVQAKP